MSACIFASPARADECAVIESRASLATLSGMRISAVDIQSEGPSLPDLVNAFGALHPVSQAGVIRRQLLFAPGDTVDTLLVGETMRRLRAQRLFSDAVILARRCDSDGSISLVVRTRDSWTLRPTARMRSSSQLSLGVEERNIFGTGRTVAFTHEMTTRGTGAAASYSDPFLFGRDISANARVANLAGAHTLRFGIRRHEYSVFDGWRAEANFARLSYRDTVVAEKALHTVSAMMLMGRRIGTSGTAVTMILAGAEFDSAASISASRRVIAPSNVHARSFVGLDVGVQRRTAQFDSASWIVPGRGFLDVPLGWEGEGIVATGYERDAGSPALKLDGWAGRVFMPRRGTVLMLDGWASSYLGRGVDRNQIARASASLYRAATGGMWGARLTVEQLLEVDPDRRGLSLMPLADYTTPVLHEHAARGGRAIAGSIERDVHLRQVAAASVLNVGGFIAGSYRWRVSDIPDGQLRAGVVGARVRVLSANGTVSSVRIDVGYPVVLSDALPRKPFLILKFGTLFDASRQRDGRRIY